MDEGAQASVAADSSRLIGRIPVRNIWLLMFYASDLRHCDVARVAVEQSPDDLPDLVAEILATATQRRLRRQLRLDYCQRSSVLTRVRGRIDIFRTERQQLHLQGRVHCRYDELSVDTPGNRYVRSALEKMARLAETIELRRCCAVLARTFGTLGVSAWTAASAPRLERGQGRLGASDELMLAAAALAFDLALPTEDAGTHLLPRPHYEAAWVRGLFERAVRGFCEVALRDDGWTLGATRQVWQTSDATPGMSAILPQMQTDIVLDHDGCAKRIIVDTKFTEILVSGRFREHVKTGYLYQMYAYLRSQAGRGDPRADSAGGLLLHPTVGTEVDESVVIQGHRLRFATVDLAAKPAQIRARLIQVLQPES